MMVKIKNNYMKMIKEEFFDTTETLWKNEVQANLMVARILLYTAGLDALILILTFAGVFFSKNDIQVVTTLAWAFFELVIPAVICLYFKGEKKWLKSVLLLIYTIVLARLASILSFNVILCLVFPVVLSVRYYSRPVTIATAVMTMLFSGIADYLCIYKGWGRPDINMLKLPAGTIIKFDAYERLRDVVINAGLINRAELWVEYFRHSYLPKMILYFLIAFVCTEIARRGRIAILEQKAETEKTERLATELNLASEIQNNVLPNIFPVFPERKEFNLYASMTPAKAVGGDFYDFFMIDDDHIALVMADVSGKGIPAALFMMVTRTLIKNRTQMGGSPSEILHDVNNQLCEGNVAELFVTIWLGILEISTGKGIAANAGHEHPVIRRKDGLYELVVYNHSPIVGVMEGMKFKQHEFKLNPGDSLFVYTDGVAEANNKEKELFGTDRMLQALNKNPDAMPDEILTNVKEGIYDFANGAEQFDDITMLCIKYFGPEK